MRHTQIAELLSQHPFHPFRIHMSDGRSFLVEHPDQVLVSPLKIVFGVGRTAEHSVSRFEHLPLLHVTGLEEMQPN